MTAGNDVERALRELDEFASDPHRERLLQKFTCQESHRLSELLGTVLDPVRGYSRTPARAASVPALAGLVHPG